MELEPCCGVDVMTPLSRQIHVSRCVWIEVDMDYVPFYCEFRWQSRCRRSRDCRYYLVTVMLLLLLSILRLLRTKVCISCNSVIHVMTLVSQLCRFRRFITYEITSLLLRWSLQHTSLRYSCYDVRWRIPSLLLRCYVHHDVSMNVYNSN